MTTEQANQLSALYNKYINGAGKTILWTNPSPSSDFAAQTLSLNLSDYRYALICISMYAADTNRDFSTLGNRLFDVGWSGTIDMFSYNYNYGRIVYAVSSSGIIFGDGYGSTMPNAAQYGIPIYVYGIM